jgi:hypothetical protein
MKKEEKENQIEYIYRYIYKIYFLDSKTFLDFIMNRDKDEQIHNHNLRLLFILSFLKKVIVSLRFCDNN